MLKSIIVCAVLLMAAGDASAGHGVRDYLKQSTDWYGSDEAKAVAANVLSWQSDLGGWPKNVDTAAQPYHGQNRGKDLSPTFDNGATTDELRLLARVFHATQTPSYQVAFLKGYDYILKAQYPTGGWPQFSPPGKHYHRYITFNDDAMVRLMEFLRETWTSPIYRFLDESRKKTARAAFDAGIQCILKCQIRVDGKLTAWCAQHDENNYAPRPGRSYELVSISGGESVGIVRLLMSLDHPSPEVIRAVQAAVMWFRTAAIRGIKVIVVEDAKSPKGTDKRVVEDPSAPPIWARFYEIGTNRPIFCDRDGVPKHKLDEIGYERRNGYSWLGYGPQRLLEREYPAWKQEWASGIDSNQHDK
jgi:pectate lyase